MNSALMTLGTLKKYFYQIIISSMILYIVVDMIPGIIAPTQPLHWIMALGVFAASNLLVVQIIKFFTIPKNILTYWIASAVLGFGAFYIMSLFLPGITIEETPLEDASFGIISVETYTLSPILTMAVAGLVSGLLNAVLYWLEKE